MHLLICIPIILALSIFTFWLLNLAGSKITEYSPVSLVEKKGNEQFNFMFGIIAPNVAIIIYALILYPLLPVEIYKSLWLLAPGVIFIRFIFNINRLSIINWRKFFASATVAIIGAYLIGLYILPNRNIIYPNLNDIIGEIWLVIIAFAYMIISNIFVSITKKSSGTEFMYIRKMYLIFKKKYSSIIKVPEYPFLETFVYSILIVENFNRPYGVRFAERIKFFFVSRGTYGIMQVESDASISDEQSITLGLNKIKQNFNDVFEATLQSPSSNFTSSLEILKNKYYVDIILLRVAWFYNKNDEYAKDVLNVYNKLVEWLEIGDKPSEHELDKRRLDAFYNSPWEKL